MDIRVKAGLKTMAFIAVAGVASVAVNLGLSALSPDELKYVVGGGIAGIVLYTMYGIFLADERYRETVKKIKSKE